MILTTATASLMPGECVASFKQKKRPAPADPSAPRAKKEPFTSPYTVFCREQRPLLPPGLSSVEREKRLGELAL